jgi:SAM-dependent methyltransferase
MSRDPGRARRGGGLLTPAPLSDEEVLAGYDAVSQLYPHIPSASAWRAWEYAAYRRYRLIEPVLDVGCGDGRFFRLLWPEVRDVVGVDMDAQAAEAARLSGVYRDVHHAPADRLPVAAESFGSAFANCSLEHMDRLPAVLTAVHRSLRPGGGFLFSVVTDKFLEWTPLPLLFEAMGEVERARDLRTAYADYHHVVNPLAPANWERAVRQAGFEAIEHVPIVPELSSRLFLLLDQLWHVKGPSGELAPRLTAYAESVRRFPVGFRSILSGVLAMETDVRLTSGAVFWARRPA